MFKFLWHCLWCLFAPAKPRPALEQRQIVRQLEAERDEMERQRNLQFYALIHVSACLADSHGMDPSQWRLQAASGLGVAMSGTIPGHWMAERDKEYELLMAEAQVQAQRYRQLLSKEKPEVLWRSHLEKCWEEES